MKSKQIEETQRELANEGAGMRVRMAEPGEKEWFDRVVEEHHELGAGKAVGDYLRQVVERRGVAVALLTWGPACYALKDRDLWIGWSATHRAERLKLVVQNRRFALLSAKGAEPNLASQSLAAALRAVPEHWQERFGYRPLLAETFSNPESHEGTCYKASNWIAAGTSAGYARHRADRYIRNDSPKKLWLYSLHAEAKRHLCAVTVPAHCARALGPAATGTLPLREPQMESLWECLCRVPDPRSRNARFRIGSVLTIVAMALLAGRREIAEIARFAHLLTQSQRRKLCLPRKQGSPGFHPVPGYSVYYQMLIRLDPDGFSQALSGWLAAHVDTLPEALALDGKYIREQIGLLSLVRHEDGTPIGITPIDQKERTQRSEQARAAPLLRSAPLNGKLVTADALHCQKEVARAIVESGGDYLLQIEGNQPTLQAHAEAIDRQPGGLFF